jgi:hypothetical protein
MTVKNKKAAKPVTSVKLNLPKSLFLKPKPIKVVTRKVLENIADNIHNPKTGHYLNLCEGTLQNGPDPVCATRQMHCGLGELYFVVTGHQPEEDEVDENGVVDLITNRSTIGDHQKLLEKKMTLAKKQIEKMDLPEALCAKLLCQFENFDTEYTEQEDNFRDILILIPNENDQGGENVAEFKDRAKRVAASIRKAAALLPR